ncbi:MAG: cytochrome c maturation protein CcmE [Alphaproteobacteria bacterium]
MKPAKRNKRLVLLAVCAVTITAAAALSLSALRDNISYFLTPSEIADTQSLAGQNIRLGGLVLEGSVRHVNDATVQFRVTDGAADLPVSYRGILPDLFREGQGVIAQGQFDPSGQFIASVILAKHDENYVPKELQHGLEKARQITS